MALLVPLRLPALRFVGATILRDGALRQRSVSIARGRITRGPLPAVDLSGYLILPGIIDMHGDGFEAHLPPVRNGVPADPTSALATADREAAASGVTTAWLTQGWSWEGGHRSPGAAEAMLTALSHYRRDALTDLRAQLRAETHMPDSGARLLAAVARWRVGAVMFDNLAERLADPQVGMVLAVHARRLGRAPDALRTDALAALALAKKVPRHLCTLADDFDRLGVLFGSYGDNCGETRERFSMIGARLAVMPRAYAAAAAARAMGEPVLMGAPGVIGVPESDDLASGDAIAAGLCDALASDGRYPALAVAAFHLADDGIVSLPEAWAMISARPAEIMRLPDRGTLDLGKRADLVVIGAASRRVECTISGGRLIYAAGQAGARLAMALRANAASRVAAE